MHFICPLQPRAASPIHPQAVPDNRLETLNYSKILAYHLSFSCDRLYLWKIATWFEKIDYVRGSLLFFICGDTLLWLYGCIVEGSWNYHEEYCERRFIDGLKISYRSLRTLQRWRHLQQCSFKIIFGPFENP